MVRAAAKAAVGGVTKPKTPIKIRTIAANDTAAQELAARRKLSRECALWAHGKGVGVKAALKEDEWKNRGLTRNMVQPLLTELNAGDSKNGRMDAPRDHHNQILTNAERLKLAEWILACAAGQDPKDRTQVSAKVKEMLRARHASNKSRKWREGSIKLNKTEVKAVHRRAPRLAKNFFERFYPWCRAQGIAIEEGVERSQDEQRAVKMTEATVERHFNGEFGLAAECRNQTLV